jgi:hypothetical protein
MKTNTILQAQRRAHLRFSCRPLAFVWLALSCAGCVGPHDSGGRPDGSTGDGEIAVVAESLTGGTNDLNDQIRNSTVFVASGCTGTLIRDDLVLTAGHCGMLASSWNDADVTQAMAWDWRALGDHDQQYISVGVARPGLAPVCNPGDPATSCNFIAQAIASSEVGQADVRLLLLDRPVPATHATPTTVMSAAKFAAIGGLVGRSLRSAGFGPFTDGTVPALRQTIPVGTATTWLYWDSAAPAPVPDLNQFWVQEPGSVVVNGGDSGGGLYWWDPSEGRQYVVGNLQGWTNSPTPHYTATFTNLSGTWHDGHEAAQMSTWLQQELAATTRNRFSPFQGDLWHPSFCASAGSVDVCTTGDFDGDGDTDIVQFRRSGGSGVVRVGASRRWRGTPPWTPDNVGFTLASWLSSGFAPAGESIAVGNANGAGGDDIAYFERTGLKRIMIAESSATPGLYAYSDPLTPVFNTTFRVARSGDAYCQTDATFCAFGGIVTGGGEDLVEINESTGTVRVLAATGTGATLALNPSAGYSGLLSACTSATCSAQLVDVDNDARADLVFLPRVGAGSTIRWARNTGSGWAAIVTLTTWSQCATTGSFCRMGDVDGDGKSDVIAIASTGTARVRRLLLTAPTDEVWSSSVCNPGFRGCETVDITGDGLADIVDFRALGTVTAPTGDALVVSSIFRRASWF